MMSRSQLAFTCSKSTINLWDLLKVNNKATRIKSVSFYIPKKHQKTSDGIGKDWRHSVVKFEQISHISGVSIVDFEQINAD